MSGFLNSANSEGHATTAGSLKMSCEQLKEFLMQIEENKSKMDLRNVIKILKVLKIAIVNLEMVELTQAEKHLRKLIQDNDCDPFSPHKQEQQIIKTVARGILQDWSQIRRDKLMLESKKRAMDHKLDKIHK